MKKFFILFYITGGSIFSMLAQKADFEIKNENNSVRYQQIQTADSIIGTIFTGSDSSLSGSVEMFNIDYIDAKDSVYVSQWGPVETRNFSNSTFIFNNIPAGKYFISAVPSGYDTMIYKETFYKDKPDIVSADTVVIDSLNVSVNISLILKHCTDTCYSISGMVHYPSSYGENYGMVTIYDINSYYRPISYCYVQEDGSFELKYVPEGNYIIMVEPLDSGEYFEPTYYVNTTYPENADILSVNSDIGGLDLYIDFIGTEMSIVTVVKYSKSSIRVYPNPANEHIYIQRLDKKTTSLSYSIADLTGRVLIKENCDLTAYNQKLTVDVSMLVRGVYLLRIQDREELWQRTLIIE